MDTDILIIGSPIWLGEKSSVCTRVIERLYGYSGKLNDEGQYANVLITTVWADTLSPVIRHALRVS